MESSGLISSIFSALQYDSRWYSLEVKKKWRYPLIVGHYSLSGCVPLIKVCWAMDIKIDRLPLHLSIIHFNMASKVSISVVVVSWVLCVFMLSTNMFIAAVSVAASESSLEAKALRESGWWSGLSNGTSLNYCDWKEIRCNEDGSVTQIEMLLLGNY